MKSSHTYSSKPSVVAAMNYSLANYEKITKLSKDRSIFLVHYGNITSFQGVLYAFAATEQELSVLGLQAEYFLLSSLHELGVAYVREKPSAKDCNSSCWSSVELHVFRPTTVSTVEKFILERSTDK